MDFLFLVLQHKRVALAFFALCFLVALFTLFSFQTTPFTTPLVSPTPTIIPLQIRMQKQQGISPLQKTVISTTRQNDISKLFGIDTIATRGAVTTYSLPSSINLLPNEIQVENGVVVFERIITPKDPTLPGFSKISDLTQPLGKPQQTINGSKTYGSYVVTYVYAEKGIAILGNPNTDIVYELHLFKPTTPTLYKETYGKDLDPNVTESD